MYREKRANLSGWGRHPKIDAAGAYFEKTSHLAGYLREASDCIAYAKGRSYGDSALNENVIFTGRFNHIIDFDPESGVVECESGVGIADLIDVFLPRGWFPAVTPGTKHVSVGGAIASDVHGKNHHKNGCFCECVRSFRLMLPNGDIVQCGRSENRELFLATCGGMGLTGIILTAVLTLQKVAGALIRETVIKCANLDEIFECFEQNAAMTYSVAWIDCLAKGKNLGRSVFIGGEHAKSGRSVLPPVGKRTVPFTMPGVFLNKWSVSLFNHFYYKKSPSFVENRLVSYDEFFYPLDKIGSWNRIYGRRGFTQYQAVLPKDAGRTGMAELLRSIQASGMGSFLAVLKLFGPENANLLSFPMEGYTLALDFKMADGLRGLFDRLDRIVTDHGGRLYLAKDVRMSGDMFRKGYPKWERFAEVREKYGLKDKFNSLQSKRIGV